MPPVEIGPGFIVELAVMVKWSHCGAEVNSVSEEDVPGGGTTLHGNASLPMSDSSWCLVQVCFLWRAVIAEASSTFHCRVIDAFIATESKLIPRNVSGGCKALSFLQFDRDIECCAHLGHDIHAVLAHV